MTRAGSALAKTLAGMTALLLGCSWAHAESFKVEVWNPPFNMESPRTSQDYTTLEKASKKWRVCVSFPHMKDAYWMAVDYGVAEEAKRLGVQMQLLEAGGYTNLNKQISQIEDCVASGSEAVIIGAISLDGLNNLVSEVRKKNIPVIDVINGISSPDLSAKSLVSFGEMGFKAGEYLAAMHPKGGEKVKVGWFPGPAGAGWVEAGNKGFRDAIANSSIEVVETKYGDTGKEVQMKLVEDTLQTYPDIKYIAVLRSPPRRRSESFETGVWRIKSKSCPTISHQVFISGSSMARFWGPRPIPRLFRGRSPWIRQCASSRRRTT